MPALATQQSFNTDTQYYKCYLCNPAKLGFRTLASLNEHLATSEHHAVNYKCPHTACHRPFKTIGGVLQHIETRGCRCISDANWWNSYFPRPTTEIASPTAQEGLEEYWVLRYAEMTGSTAASQYTDSASVDDTGCGCGCVSFAVVILCLLALIYWSH